MKTGGWKCCAPHCKSNSKDKTLKFHRFPRNKELGYQWLEAFGIKFFKENAYSVYKRKRVCGLHFSSKNRKKIPTLFLKQKLPSVLDHEILFLSDYDVGRYVEISEKIESENDVAPFNKNLQEKSEETSNFNEHNYSFSGNISILKGLHENIHSLHRENESLTNQNKKMHFLFDVDYILKRVFLLNFYTGFDDVERYNLFQKILTERSQLYRSILKIRGSNVSEKTQIFIFFSRLRLGLKEVDLAVRHNVSQTTICRIINYWLNITYTYLIQVPLWPSKATVNKYMPDSFRKIYPNVRIILDATEIKIQKPSDYTNQSSTYSHYKSCNTAKGIIGITPNGFISFVSDLYPGRMSDKEIFVESKLVTKLEKGDSVMADRGFTIMEEVRAADCDLIIPPFLNKANQLNMSDEQTTRDIACLRVHVERTIGAVKSYNILRTTLPNNAIDQLHKVWFVCSILPNFTKPPLLDRKK